MVVGKRCLTCIDRKIRCDRGTPACSECIRTNRPCKGYGLRLSWPRGNDRKRFVIGPVPTGLQRGQRVKTGGHAIHVTPWDMMVYRYLTDLRHTGDRVTPLPLYPTVPAFYSLTMGSEVDLLQYFESVVSSSLTTFTEKPVGGLIIRVALSENSPSSTAVQKAILALSSLFRHGAGLQADQLKLSALHALVESAGMGITSENAVQHVVAGIILCLFEISHNAESARQWMWYITGAKEVIANAPGTYWAEENGLHALFDWAYYYEVLARFSALHWRPQSKVESPHSPPDQASALRADTIDQKMTTCDAFPARNRALILLSEVCKAVLPSSDPMSRTTAYRERIAALKQEVEYGGAFGPPLSQTIPGLNPDMATRGEIMAQLHQIAMLIYLSRATDDRAQTAGRLESFIDRGMATLTALSHCDRPFPILILGFEARDDGERMAVLDLIARTRRNPYPKHRLECVRNFLQGVWNQMDLHAEDGVGIDYLETLTAVVSTSEIIPPLV